MQNSLSTINHSLSTDLISSEIKFLIACCKTDPSEDDIKYIHTYLSQITDHGSRSYDDIIHLAYQHGILPLVYKTLKELNSNGKLLITDHKILSAFKQYYLNIAQRNMLMSAELIRIMKLLETNGIEALAFKGPTLAQIAYEDITLRQYVDLDILVDEQLVAQTGKLLVENGFEPMYPMKILNSPICLELNKDFSFLSQSSKIHIEMHWQLVPKELNTYFDFDKLMQETQSVSINGKTVYTLSTEHLLIYLCIHGSKHAWERIEWICDIDRLIRNLDINWNNLLIYTKSKNDRSPLLLGLLLSQTLFHTPLPKIILKIMSNEPQLNELIVEVIDFFNNASINNSDLKRIYLIESFVAKVFHKKQNKTLTFLKKLFKITSGDCKFFILPKKLKFLYMFLRPFRLIYTRLSYSDK